jgi:hypothetical protein
MSCRVEVRCRALGLLGLLLLASGCGVDDYEKKMIEAQHRIARFEEEDRVLGRPLEIPKHTDKNDIKRPWANLFFRPPKGISYQPVESGGDNSEVVLRGGLLYDYLPPPKTTAGGIARVELAFGEQKPEELRTEVMRRFTSTSNPQSRQRSFRIQGRQTGTNFETIEFDGNDEGIDYFYSINLTHNKEVSIAVVFWVLKGQQGATIRLIDMSLESFALDEEANRARELFSRGSPLLVPQHPR